MRITLANDSSKVNQFMLQGDMLALMDLEGQKFERKS